VEKEGSPGSSPREKKVSKRRGTDGFEPTNVEKMGGTNAINRERREVRNPPPKGGRVKTQAKARIAATKKQGKIYKKKPPGQKQNKRVLGGKMRVAA